MPPLSPRALELLEQLFNATSNLVLPVGVAAQVLEIRQWVAAQRVVRPEQS